MLQSHFSTAQPCSSSAHALLLCPHPLPHYSEIIAPAPECPCVSRREGKQASCSLLQLLRAPSSSGFATWVPGSHLLLMDPRKHFCVTAKGMECKGEAKEESLLPPVHLPKAGLGDSSLQTRVWSLDPSMSQVNPSISTPMASGEPSLGSLLGSHGLHCWVFSGV